MPSASASISLDASFMFKILGVFVDVPAKVSAINLNCMIISSIVACFLFSNLQQLENHISSTPFLLQNSIFSGVTNEASEKRISDVVHPKNISKELVSLNAGVSDVPGIIMKMEGVGGNFNHKQDFDYRESIIKWIRRMETTLGFGVVIGRSDNGSERRNPFVTLLCERSGIYQVPLQKFKRDNTGNRKCECPFKICGYMLASKKWKFSVVCGSHNHEMCSKLQGHPNGCRIKPEEKTCINDLTLNLVQPKNILATLKRKKHECNSNIRQVYNIRYRNNNVIREDRSEIQLLKLLDDNKYVSRYRTCANGVTTNKYRLPLFEMVGVTSTEKTYCVGFAFLECEKKNNYVWALEVCQSLLKPHVELSKAIVTDRDTALMNVVEEVFLTSYALLCIYHITKNVRSRVKPAVGTKQVSSEDGKSVKTNVIVEKIMTAWNSITNSSTKDLYADSVIDFRKVCEKYPDLLKYVESTNIDQVKEKLVCGWTDNVRHLRNTTTNIVESIHATLKNWLGTSKRYLC